MMPLRSKGKTPAKPSKRQLVSQSDSGLEGTALNLSAAGRQRTRPRQVLVSDIRPDPDNIRHLNLTVDLLKRPEAIEDESLREEAEYIIGLSRTMATEGQIQPGVAHQSSAGDVVWLISGERRWLALQLAGIEHMDLMVYADRPEHAARIQLLENIQRRDIDLVGSLRGMQAVVAEDKANGNPVETGGDLMERLGMNKSEAFRWWSVLNAGDDVVQAIVDGRIESLTVAGEVARIKDAATRRRLLAADDVAQAVREFREKPDAKGRTKKQRGGRPVKKVSLGRVENTNVVRRIVQTVDPELDLDSVDWSDPKAVAQLWSAFIKRMDQQD